MSVVAPPVALDTMVVVSRAIDAHSIERYLRQRSISVAMQPFSGQASNACVVLSAHEFEDAQLLDICAGLKHCWVHLVSAGAEYAGLPGLCRENLLTRSWRAYGCSLTEYVLAALIEVEWRDGYHWSKCSRLDGERGLFGRSALVFGFGAIGQSIAYALKAIGVRVSVVHQHRPEGFSDGLQHLVLSDLEAEYDYFILALPGTSTTQHLVDGHVLSHLKTHGHLINVGRGTTIDTDALCLALEERSIWATLDVTDPEPLPADHVLRRCARARISDHVAWQSGQSELCFLDDWMALQNLLRAERDLPQEAIVNSRFCVARSEGAI